MKEHPYRGARRMKPTRNHRLAIWENMLGTVYAMNAKGEVKYFDYDWDGARKFAGVTSASDPRVWKTTHGYQGYTSPDKGKWVLWVLREPDGPVDPQRNVTENRWKLPVMEDFQSIDDFTTSKDATIRTVGRRLRALIASCLDKSVKDQAVLKAEDDFSILIWATYGSAKKPLSRQLQKFQELYPGKFDKKTLQSMVNLWVAADSTIATEFE